MEPSGGASTVPVSTGSARTASVAMSLVQPSGTATKCFTTLPCSMSDSTWAMGWPLRNSYSPALRLRPAPPSLAARRKTSREPITPAALRSLAISATLEPRGRITVVTGPWRAAGPGPR